jgi:sialic acid synthase SpsE
MKNKKVYFIAEAGLNHNGNVNIAKKLIDVAVEANSDAVKFQKREVNQIATKDVLDAPFTNFPELGKTYREVRESLELTKSEYKLLREYSREKNIDFIVTPFDIQSLEFLDDLELDGIKLAAHSLTDIPLLEEVSKRKVPIYFSAGMCTWDDIERAIKALDPTGIRTKNSDISLNIFHVVSQYPMEIEFANLPMITELIKRYPQYVIGWSDHQNGISLVSSAIALGAQVVEKHYTLDRTMKGFDHAMSLEPLGLKKAIRDMHIANKAMNYHPKEVLGVESKCHQNYRRTIVASIDIPKGTKITRDMLTTKAPNRGLSPKHIPDLIGKITKRDIKEDTHIQFEDIEL